ncbi:MAG: Crp/Fnr family transcriptional regulator [Thermoflexibacter sp.]|nr:Crp/Fnr family transcriptional regulator [Thermoflexibacter sp.]
MLAYRKLIENFIKISYKEWEEYESYLTIKKLATNEFFLQAGQVCKHVAFVQTGLVRMYIPTPNKEITVDLISEGKLITDYPSLLAKKPSKVCIEAVEPSELLLLSEEKMQVLYKNIAEGQKLGRLIAEMLYVQAVERLEIIYSETIEERYLRLNKILAPLAHRVPQYYIASIMGIAPETLSRIKRKIEKKQYVH